MPPAPTPPPATAVGTLARRRSGGLPGGALLPWVCLLAAAGCELPLDLPTWDTRWTLVAAADTVDVDGLLPEGVRQEEGLFLLDSIRSSEEVLLDQVCEFCTCFQGPVPSLEITPFDWAVPLPPGISSASLNAGTARIGLVNGVGFDLLRSRDGGEGYLQVVLLDRRSGEALDSLRLSQPFPPGDTLRAEFDLEGLEFHRDVVARVRGRIPGSGCDTIPLTPEMGIRTEVDLVDVVAGRVEVLLRDADLNLPSRSLELPAPLARRLRPGESRLRLEVRLESTLPVGVDALLSVAGRPEALFTESAALYTPIPVPGAGEGPPVAVHRVFVLDPAALEGGSALHLATSNRVVGERRIQIRGTERVSWVVTLHAEIPLR